MTRALLAYALAGCASFDLSQPIDLVPDPTWSDTEQVTLANAAECWNLQYGTKLAVTTQPDTTQMVYFDYAAIACWDSWGRYLAGEPAHDSICPLGDIDRYQQSQPADTRYATAVLLFTVVEHELGHALNIRNVASGNIEIDGPAVMVYNYEPTYAYQYGLSDPPAFTAFDGDQLAAANPGFAPQPVCPRVVLVPDPTSGVACACP